MQIQGLSSIHLNGMALANILTSSIKTPPQLPFTFFPAFALKLSRISQGNKFVPSLREGLAESAIKQLTADQRNHVDILMNPDILSFFTTAQRHSLYVRTGTMTSFNWNKQTGKKLYFIN